MPDTPELPKVRDVQCYLDSVNKFELPLAQHRYEYLRERRDLLFDKLRTGSIVLNAAALTAVLTALGNPAVAKGKFGLDISTLAFSSVCYLTGLILGVIGYWIEAQRTQGELATQFDRMSRQMRLRGHLDNTYTESNSASAKEAMTEVHELPQRDFGYSWTATLATNCAGGAWIGGTVAVLWKLNVLITWFP